MTTTCGRKPLRRGPKLAWHQYTIKQFWLGLKSGFHGALEAAKNRSMGVLVIGLLTDLRRRVYVRKMKDTSKRGNSYWLGRLEKEGHGVLLAQIEAGEMSVYEATQKAGYRKKGPRSAAGKLSYHWQRASHAERKRFIAAHAKDVNRVLREWGEDMKQLKAQKPSG